MPRLLPVLLGMALAGVAVSPVGSGAELGKAASVGQLHSLAPDFTRPDRAGRSLRLADYKGRVVLLNFWASWCGPCLVEMPQFANWQRRYGDAGLQVVGVAMDDDPAAADRYLKGHPVPYPVVMGDVQLAHLYGGVYGLPVSLLIDRSGRVVFRSVGEPKLDALRSQIEALLRAP